jgi:glutamate dehydrogenase/leucine dehydrogenase
MLQLRKAHGDRFVHHMHENVTDDPAKLFDIEADVLVPGARTGVIAPAIAETLNVRWIAPAANAPYTKSAVPILQARRIRYLPDFVLNAGGVIGFVCGADTAAGILAEVGRIVTELTTEACVDPAGPYVGACRMAERFLATWREPGGMPDGPPLA